SPAFSPGEEIHRDDTLQRVLSGPHTDDSDDEQGRGALSGPAGALVVGGSAAEQTGGDIRTASGFLARVGGTTATSWWKDYGTTTGDVAAGFQCAVPTADGGLLAGGASGGVGYLVRINSNGLVRWERTVDGLGVEAIVGLVALEGGTFLAIG